MNDNEMRDALYDAVYREFVGPVDRASEEEIEIEPQGGPSPKKLYYAGVLYPQGILNDGMPLDESGDTEEEGSAVIEDENKEHHSTAINTLSSLTDDEEPVSLSNAEYQSAISLTIAAEEDDILSIEVNAGVYEKEKAVDSDGERVFYKRAPIFSKLENIELPSRQNRIVTRPVGETSLSLVLVYRYEVDEACVITIALKNSRRSPDPCHCDLGDCYFQCEFSVTSKKGFVPLPTDSNRSLSNDPEKRSNRLIYSEIRNYALGHGCAADWDEGQRPKTICTMTIPMEEVKPPTSSVNELDGVSFDMNMLADPDRWEESRHSLERLCDEYDRWIDGIEAASLKFGEEWEERAAKKNIEECRLCAERIRRGVSILAENDVAREAFQLANKAMLSQYIHYSVVANENPRILEEQDGLRFWRPFQIAFILMNIDSMTYMDSEERHFLDLIWFPTGGGKTEAYLGLSAYTLLIERLMNEQCQGTSIIMRYTLRLLSSQQFQRAASLICALEVMRRDDPARLGEKRFSIGFWVGESASPNTWSGALKIFEQMRKGEVPEKKIPVTQCPWCGAELADGPRVDGFKREKNNDVARGDSKYYLKFVCPNEECDFHERSFSLPLAVVDEEIYYDPPSLLLGTVDKFATIPYRPESYAIFGIGKNGERLHAPKLIIQDELHLISGPLGSMTAHYETLIDRLCAFERGGLEIRPKIIASTATVSRAKAQCHELFACEEEKVLQFPPSGISYDDSFFSREDKEAPGRRYVGIFAPNTSFATASIKLYSQLLWQPVEWDDETVDDYWSIIGYYGTTRELGQALTWTASDIPERLYEKRRRSGFERKRSLYESGVVELTGRKDAREVADGLDRLKIKRGEQRCVDLCLATNMIAVGLDVPRLGVMVIAGQPKETSEYIQASSRVGRGDDMKGIVFVLYGTSRPRDRSHYENFKNYHQGFYQHVEPSSVTAFCGQVRERALRGMLIGLYRSLNPGLNEPPASLDEDSINYLKAVIDRRVSSIDPDEAEGAMDDLNEFINEWDSRTYERWGSMNPNPVGERDKLLPLMYPPAIKPNPAWRGHGFKVPTSMRSVDEECKVRIVPSYGRANAED